MRRTFLIVMAAVGGVGCCQVAGITGISVAADIGASTGSMVVGTADGGLSDALTLDDRYPAFLSTRSIWLVFNGVRWSPTTNT